MKKAIFAGSFDPLTLGHIAVIEKSLKIFDELILVVSCNSVKKYLFTAEERKGQISSALIECLPEAKTKISLYIHSGILVDFAKNMGVKHLIRGVRNNIDYIYEMQLALTNKHLAEEIETLFIPIFGSYSYISSSLVKEVAMLKGDIANMVPKNIALDLYKKIQ